MANNINIDSLSGEIEKALKVYSSDIVEKIDTSSERIAKKAIKNLKANSPKKTGKYSKSWTQKKEKGDIMQPTSHTIYNKEGWLTHLLENGHAKVGGGRVEAKPHIRPAEQKVIEEFTKEVEEAIKNAGTL